LTWESGLKSDVDLGVCLTLGNSVNLGVDFDWIVGFDLTVSFCFGVGFESLAGPELESHQGQN